jgi:hypothetical protein
VGLRHGAGGALPRKPSVELRARRTGWGWAPGRGGGCHRVQRNQAARQPPRQAHLRVEAPALRLERVGAPQLLAAALLEVEVEQARLRAQLLPRLLPTQAGVHLRRLGRAGQGGGGPRWVAVGCFLCNCGERRRGCGCAAPRTVFGKDGGTTTGCWAGGGPPALLSMPSERRQSASPG